MIKQLRQQIKPSMEELPGLELGMTSCTDVIQEQQGTASLISFAIELQRRGQLNENYKTLRNLIKNPSTKEDRATVIRDAIKYVIQLIRTVYELKQLVEKNRIKKLDTIGGVDVFTPVVRESQYSHSYNDSSIGPSFSKKHSWVQRKSKDTEIDVRLIGDEVTIKVLHRRKKNNYCLLFVSRVLDELQMDLHFVSSCYIGYETNYFQFKTKINGGSSSANAHTVASKLIEVLDSSCSK
ncbi:PREDICTED: transcription factor bHLH89-like [Populus euphratica]|uniref:Transcription factor bHLH89-like n=1 Tax=Populus euphratica TaxID=75702 RepID=A0AAJ6Y4H6_POPEU|nr:PREDICTED: transcription factor bHLH89-like [Populus euphratica]